MNKKTAILLTLCLLLLLPLVVVASNRKSMYIDGTYCAGSCGRTSSSGNAESAGGSGFYCQTIGTLYYRCNGIMEHITKSDNREYASSVYIYTPCMEDTVEMKAQHIFVSPKGIRKGFTTSD